jgi:hypothetical protein
LIGHHEPFYDIQHGRSNFMVFRNAGGARTFLEFDVAGGYAHGVLSHPDLSQGHLEEYLVSLTATAKHQSMIGSG